ncbi:NAD(P)-binding domain-containing protein [Vibrio aquimaris]|uniref:Putative oxidoreductase CzcO n=1 Tax=Vibrio aquimaris TaxID=2587862 RepID=A0A5P9CMX9_9VIBR|nr:NAD(P)-binding domain-containing protein [Vibrio aquimaris]QFT27313.1 putative oxidoreductase CzcO [Vibrio aquimaris]
MHHEYIIIGAGPAGLQLAYYLEKSNEDYLILEKGDCSGSAFKTLPKHGKLISINKVYTGYNDDEINLRWDWNSLLNDEGFLFKDYSKKYFPDAKDLVDYLNDFKDKFGINVAYNTDIVSIDKGEHFSLRGADGKVYTCEKLIIATGLAKENKPCFPGSEYVKTYTKASINPDDYKNKSILILGKGNSAFETADNLIETASVIHMLSPTPVKLAWKTHYVGHLRAVNNNILDTYQLKSQNTILDAEVTKVTKDNEKYIVDFSYTHANGQHWQIIVDEIISCIGFSFDDSMFEGAAVPQITDNKKYPKMTESWESSNVEDMYFAGTIMHMRDYKQSFSGFIHGFRYNVKALAEILKMKQGKDAFHREKLHSFESVYKKIMQRIHSNSSLYQQPGFISDILLINDGNVEYVIDIPVDLIEKIYRKQSHIRFTFEYGKKEHPDPFNVVRVPDDGDSSTFIHPVFRVYQDGVIVEEYHIPEDLQNEWDKEMYTTPFQSFLKMVLPLERKEMSQNERHETLDNYCL